MVASVNPPSEFMRGEPRREAVMRVDVSLNDANLDVIAGLVAEILARHAPSTRKQWLDVPSAASHVALTEDAVRGLVKRRQIPFHRTATG
jgi:hypothetical protein